MAAQSWLDSVPHLNVQNEFQDLVQKLYAFSADERHIKYAEIFLVMADPLDSFRALMTSPQPPQDVMVATLSGCLRTLLQQLMSRKTGLRGNKKFTQHCQQVSMALAKFVSLMQEALRAYQSRPPEQASRHSEVKMGLTNLLSQEELRNMINDLREIPTQPKVSQLFWMSLSEFPLFTQTGLLLIFISIGAIICSTWYSSAIEEKRLMYIVPSVMAGAGIFLIFIGYCRAWSMYDDMIEAAYALTIRKDSRSSRDRHGYVALPA